MKWNGELEWCWKVCNLISFDCRRIVNQCYYLSLRTNFKEIIPAFNEMKWNEMKWWTRVMLKSLQLDFIWLSEDCESMLLFVIAKIICARVLFVNADIFWMIDLTNDWSSRSPCDLLHSVPYTWFLSFCLKEFELVTVANQFNWVDCSSHHQENGNILLLNLTRHKTI